MSKTELNSDDYKLPAWAIVAVVLITTIHLVALPLVVSTDGRVYIELSSLFFTDQFHENWYSARTPLFPFSIFLITKLCGFGSSPILLMNALFLVGGIFLSTKIVARLISSWAAGVYCILFALFPPLVGYSHVLLPEIGIFFFFSLILYVALLMMESFYGSGRRVYLLTLALGISLAIGYLFRQSLIYLLAPIILTLLIAMFIKLWRSRNEQFLLQLFRTSLVLILMCIPPLITARLWTSFAGDDRNMAKIVFKHGFIKQGLLSVDAFDDEVAKKLYESQVTGRQGLFELPLVGFSGSAANKLYKHVSTENFSFAESLQRNPSGYFYAVIRTTLYYLGAPSIESQIIVWAEMAFAHRRTKVTGSHPQLAARLAREGSKSLVADGMLSMFGPVLRAVWILSSLGTIFMLFLALIVRDVRLMLLTFMPISFIFMHSLTCFAVDRYILPIIPIMFINFLFLVTMKWRKN